MLKALLLDAGMTILDPREPIGETYLRKAEDLGIRIPRAEFLGQFRSAWRNAAREFRSANPDLESSDALERDAWRAFTALVAQPFPALAERHGEWLGELFRHFDSPDAWQPVDGIFELIGTAKSRGFRIGVVSNWHNSLHAILAGHRLNALFDFVLTSASAGRKKPHPRIFEAALEQVGTPPDNTLHLGDSEHDDVEGARKLGIRTVLFNRGETRVDSAADHVVSSLRQALRLIE